MPDYAFDDIEELQRNREIEGRLGAELGLPGGRTLIVLAASDANPKWRAQSERIAAELRRMANARAPNDRLRDFLARKYAECLVIGWRGVTSGGADVPFSIEACHAFLVAADDAYAAVDAVVYENKNFRGRRLEAIVDDIKN